MNFRTNLSSISLKQGVKVSVSEIKDVRTSIHRKTGLNQVLKYHRIFDNYSVRGSPPAGRRTKLQKRYRMGARRINSWKR